MACTMMEDSSVDPTINGMGENEESDEMEVEEMVEIDKKELAELEKDKGNQFYKKKDYSTAIKHYTKAIEYSPETVSYYSNRSAALMMQLSYKEALKDARTALKIDNTFAKAYIREAKCHIALGSAQAALIALQTAKDLDPSSDSAIMAEVRHARMLHQYEEQAKTAADMKDYRQVEYYMRSASKISPACTRYRVMQGENLALMGKYDEAQNIALDILRTDKMNADAVYIRGICLYYDDNIDKAVTFFTHALKLSPDHQNARQNLKKAKLLSRKKEEGNQAFKLGKVTKALELYSEALAVDPNNRKTNAKLFCNRALVSGKLKKYQEALDDCNMALELDPHYHKALQRRAKCYMDLEMYEEAVQQYHKLLQQNRTRENQQLLKEAEVQLKRSKRKDYYKILGVSKDASDDQIKKAYRKQALVHHPDRHANASEEDKKSSEQKFKEVGEAYSVLSDRKKRDRYDRGEDLDGPSMQDFDPNNIFQMFFGGGGGPGMNFSHGGHEGFGHGGGHRQQQGQGGFPGFSFQFG